MAEGLAPEGLAPVPLSRVEVTPALEASVLAALRSGKYILGPLCARFERDLAAFFGRRHAVLGSSWTAIAMLALQALGIARGDEVLVNTLTAFPTIEAIVHAGAVPVFCDADERTLGLDPEEIRRRATPRTRAVMPVHLHGHPCDMERIAALAAERSLPVLEDCAQAHGARFAGRPVGTFGRFAALSFYPSKNLPVAGDGGAILTDDDALAGRVRMLRDHGRAARDTHELYGWNLRFNELQAACGLHFLERLPAMNARRREVAGRYLEGLAGIAGLRLPEPDPRGEPAWHLFVVRVPAERRGEIRDALRARGVETGVHYPVPCHLQPAVLADGRIPRVRLPTAERASQEVLSLPIFPSITDDEVARVIAAVRALL